MEKLTIIIPAYNETEILADSVARLRKIETSLVTDGLINDASDMLIVDDGSKDDTWAIIEHLHQEDPLVCGLKFSRNFGHQSALIAGMTEAVKESDMMVSIDADLQDDPDKIVDMVKAHQNGADIVYGVRGSRESDSWFKRTTARTYYALLRFLGVDLVPDHADFRLTSKRATETFLSYPERNMFIRGIIPKLGFPSEKVYYDRTPRMAGESKYPLRKMLAFAWDGITSLSIAPVRMILALGIIALVISIIMAIYSLVTKLTGDTVHGWSSLMLSIWFLGGLQMISLSIIGEYIGKMSVEVKHRPRYTVETVLK